MKYNELMEQRGLKVAEIEKIANTAEAESRSATEAEVVSLKSLKDEVRAIEEKMELAKELEEIRSKSFTAATEQPKANTNEMKDFNLSDFRSQGEKKLPSFLTEQRAGEFTKTEPNAQPIGKEDVLGLEGALLPNLIVNQLGANFRSNVNDTKLVLAPDFYDTQAPSFNTETGTAVTMAGDFTTINFAPNRVAIQVPISKRFMNQDAVGATAYVLQQARDMFARKVESVMFSATTGVSNTPDGLLAASNSTAATVTGDATGENISYSEVLRLRGILGAARVDLGKVKFATTFALENEMRGIKMDAGSGQFMVNGGMGGFTSQVNQLGLPILASQIMIDNKSLMGDFSKLYVQMFDNMDVTYDPYTLASEGQDRWVFQFEIDWKVIKPECLLAVTDSPAP